VTTPSAYLADLTWPEVEDRVAGGAVLVVPIGSTEQHGPHLPLSTDSDIARAVCERVAALEPRAVIAPLVPYGSSGEHAAFAGTLSIGQAATELLLVELGRSAFDTFGEVLFVSAHGGNAGPVARAVKQLHDEGRDVLLFSVHWDGDPHAGHSETSLQLALDPRRVRRERAEAGDVRPLAQIADILQTGGVRAVSRNGVLGDPTGANPAAGATLITELAREAAALLGARVGSR
jgi:mycofactocin system creatininase family protein